MIDIFFCFCLISFFIFGSISELIRFASITLVLLVNWVVTAYFRFVWPSSGRNGNVSILLQCSIKIWWSRVTLLISFRFNEKLETLAKEVNLQWYCPLKRNCKAIVNCKMLYDVHSFWIGYTWAVLWRQSLDIAVARSPFEILGPLLLMCEFIFGKLYIGIGWWLRGIGSLSNELLWSFKIGWTSYCTALSNLLAQSKIDRSLSLYFYVCVLPHQLVPPYAS